MTLISGSLEDEKSEEIPKG